MTLQQLRYFMAVAQHSNFSKAAQAHYVSQTAVSQQIKLLEEELEVQLFRRGHHTVQMTPAGQVLYEYALKILALTEDAARQTRAAAAECSTPLEIGIMSGMEKLPLLEQLLQFRERHPSIPIRFHHGHYDVLQKRLLAHKVDLILRLELIPPEDPAVLHRVFLSELRQYVVLNRQSHLASHSILDRSQLTQEPYYMTAIDRDLWSRFSQVLVQDGTDLTTVHFVDSMESLVLQIAFWGGYTVLAEPVLAQIPSNKNLAFIPLKDATISACALWNTENISPSLALLLDELNLEQP